MDVPPTPTRRKETQIDPAPYDKSLGLKEIFPLHGRGILTGCDDLAVGFDGKNLQVRIEVFRRSKTSAAYAAKKLGITGGKAWKPDAARRALGGIADVGAQIHPVQYRPLDSRGVFYHDSIIALPNRTVLRHLLPRGNRALVVSPAGTGRPFRHVWITDTLIDDRFLSDKTSDKMRVFPLYRVTNYGKLSLGKMRNFGYDFFRVLVKTLGVKCRYPDGMPKGADPDQIFDYIYAILQCPGYAAFYADELGRDYPRIPVVGSLQRFNRLRDLGRTLSGLHLLQTPDLEDSKVRFSGNGSDRVERPPVLENGTVRINERQGFGPIPQEAWDLRVGERYLCRDWLACRLGRVLPPPDRLIFIKIIEALRRTAAVRAELDAEIGRQGGWPIR